jgi:hypothetical protein
MAFERIRATSIAVIGLVSLDYNASWATTYQYNGPLYTSFGGPNPAILGNRMTATVTFASDTSSLTGTFVFGVGNYPAFDITSGSITRSGNPFGSNEYFTFTAGAISQWILVSFSPSDQVLLQTISCPNPLNSACGDTASVPVGPFSSDFAKTDGSLNGVWTEVTPVPPALPLFATGLALIGLLGFRSELELKRQIFGRSPE